MTATRSLILAALLAGLLVGAGLAEHDPSGDKYQRANENATTRSVLPVETVHRVTYEKMPAVRQRLEDVTGREVDYSLVHVCVGSDCMDVDPFRFNK